VEGRYGKWEEGAPQRKGRRRGAAAPADHGLSRGFLRRVPIEALIIAKVILIGKALGVGRRAGARTLALSVLRSSLIYGGLVAIFAVLEHVIEALVHGKTFAVGVDDLLSQGIYEIGGRVLVLFVAFIPFFAFWELGSLTGETKLFDYFFKKGAAQKG
jgi:hypothetical protein